jgi:hypothetical protein
MLGELKIILMSAVPDPLTVKALIDGLDAGYRSRKHIITGTFTTNGHSPKILAYHTTQPRPSTKKPAFRTATMRNVLDGIKEMLYNLVALQQADLSEIEFRIGSINPGIANPMTVALQTSETPNAVYNRSMSKSAKSYPANGSRRVSNTPKTRMVLASWKQRSLHSDIQKPTKAWMLASSGLVPSNL